MSGWLASFARRTVLTSGLAFAAMAPGSTPAGATDLRTCIGPVTGAFPAHGAGPACPGCGMLYSGQIRYEHRLRRAISLQRPGDLPIAPGRGEVDFLKPVSELIVPESFVRSIGESIGEEGQRTLGVFRVETKAGPMVLRTEWLGFSNSIATGTLNLHAVLSGLGYMPRLRGVLMHAEMMKLGRRIPGWMKENEFIAHRGFRGVLMDEVPDAWLSRDAVPPARLHQWDLDAIIARMEEITDWLSRNRVDAADLQFLISGEGKVHLIDLEDFKWYAPAAGRNEPGLQRWIREQNAGRLAELVRHLRRLAEKGGER